MSKKAVTPHCPPTFGLAADNCIELGVVLADGNFIKTYSAQNSDLFWAMRGGGAGSWGIKFPNILDALRGGQYFYLSTLRIFPPSVLSGTTDTGPRPLYNLSLMMSRTYLVPDDAVSGNLVLCSRFIPATAYKNGTLVGQVYQQLLNSGVLFILGNLVAEGQVAANANINNVIIPAWRTAKIHVQGNLTLLKNTQILQQLSGPDAGAYSNEADFLEANFQTTFFGPNYAKLSSIKTEYDPTDLFIVKAGVGSEGWDSDGLCKG